MRVISGKLNNTVSGYDLNVDEMVHKYKKNKGTVNAYGMKTVG